MHKDLTPEDLEFLRFATDMRLRGVHPDWMYVFRGAYELNGPDWLPVAIQQASNGNWPLEAHLSPAFYLNSPDFYSPLIKQGKPWWDALERKQSEVK